MTGWSEWQTLHVSPSFTPATLTETLDGGQAFRWRREHATSWLGIWGPCVARLQLANDQALQWSAPTAIAPRVAAALPTYLALDTDFVALADQLPWRSDTILANALSNWRGLRLLRQPFDETLLCFLCSASKRIAQIKQMTETLAQRLGAEIVPGIHRLPTWDELADVPETELRACALGFRAQHVHQTARQLAAQPGWLEETASLPYDAAHNRLITLPGVGPKIADCVLLFGAARYSAFPVDTWVLKTMSRRYGLTAWTGAHVAHFGRVHFGANAGFAQQVLFADERHNGRIAG
ncbi:MAG: DNA-binding protein [Opitutae bacterium]|nr:DNA-binding protein [Opitutae bacterium]